jgi:outer membrane protein assembly factor BamB
MPKTLRICLLLSVFFAGLYHTAAAEDWRQFRGSDNRSVVQGKQPPRELSDTSVAWKTALAGEAVCGPIVVGGRVITTASSGGREDRLHVFCLDSATGQTHWERQFWATGRPFCHPTSAIAAPTPACDGKYIYAFYSTNDLVCLDLEGNLRWLRGLTFDYPSAANDVGMAASPLVVGDTVVVQVESLGDSFAAGIDTATGATRWRIPRPKMMNWTSPTLLSAEPGQELVLLPSAQGIAAVRPKTGEIAWSVEEPCNVIPSPAVDGELIVVPGSQLFAIRASQASAAQPIVWRQPKLSPSSGSPVVSGGRVYSIKGTILACGNSADGEHLWDQRLKGTGFWATPVLAQSLLYTVSSDGLLQVVDVSGERPKVVSEYDFAEPVLGSPAIASGAVYVRSEKRLWKLQ